jgi:hypothetical protein
MSGFASSFEKSFVPAAKSSSDATLELLKEKIKLDAEKKLKDQKSSALDVTGLQAIEQLKQSGASQDIIDMATTSLETGSAIKDADVKEKYFLNQQKMFSTIITNAEKQKAKSTAIDASNANVMDMLKQIGLGVQDAQPQSDLGSQISSVGGTQPTVSPFDMSITVSESGRLKPTIQPRTADEILQKQLSITKLQQQTSPEFQASAASKKELEKEYVKTSGNIESAFTGLNDSFTQLNKALPNSNLDKYPNVVSKLFGSVAELGTKTGFTSNKDLAPAIARLKGNAYKLARALDPSGRISDKDLEASVGQIFNVKQSASERKNNLTNLMFDVASTMRPEQRERLAQEKPELAEGFKSIGLDFVTLNREDTMSSGDTKKSFSSLWS